VTTEDRSGVDAEGSRRWFGRAVLLGAPIAAAVVLLDGQAASASSGDPWIAGGNASAVTDTLGTTNASSLLIVTGGTERIRVDGTDGRVGIGTTTPSANTALHVRSTTKAFTARVDNSAVNGVSVLANATGAGGRGVTGQAAGTNGSAIAGYGIAPGTDINGVYGESQVANGRGVKGVATATGGEGVRGESAVGTGIHGLASVFAGQGVYGEHIGTAPAGSASDFAVGVLGNSVGPRGVGVQGLGSLYGVQGTSTSGNGVRGKSGSGVGVLAESVSSDGVYSSSSSGRGVVGVSGSVAGVAGLCGSSYGVFGESSTAAGVYGTSTSSHGVRGVVASASGSGVFGENTNSAGVGVAAAGFIGLNATTNTAGGAAVQGTAFAPATVAANFVGLVNVGRDVGSVVSPIGSPAIHGWANTGDGVQGRTVNTNAAGVAGHFQGTGAGNGVFGGAPTGAGQYAGFFAGNVHVTGTLSKANGTFKIDHPQDPANRYLVHSFVESPEMKNVYDGVATCDENGEAVVQMPTYFEALNCTFRYQLTPLGASAPNLYIADRIADGRFRIAGGLAGLDVSWMVTGVRQDAFAQANPVVVESEKAEADRGYYLHPELFGSDGTRRIGFNFNKLANVKGSA
jgi:hypothetical protein